MNLLTHIVTVLAYFPFIRPEEDSNDDNHEKKKYYQMSNDRWSNYKEKIGKAVRDYKQCDPADCFKLQRRSDFRFWVDNGGIKESDFLHARDRKHGEHYQIINQKLYRTKSCIFPSRCAGNEHFILQTVKDLPNMELIINTFDWPKVAKYETASPALSFSKTSEERDLLYPAWTFWEGGPSLASIYPTGLGRWDQQIEKHQRAAEKWPWKRKLQKGFFRGSRTSHERDPLVLLSRKEPNLVDAAYTKNQAWKSPKDTLNEEPAEEVPLHDHCKYKYLFNFRGVAASFRFKHLFLCESLVFHVGSEWTEFFYGSMKPWVHYIPVSTSLDDVHELLEFVKENDDLAREIAERGHAFILNHLKMEDVENYWLKLLRRYGKLMKWIPQRNNTLIEITG